MGEPNNICDPSVFSDLSVKLQSDLISSLEIYKNMSSAWPALIHLIVTEHFTVII